MTASTNGTNGHRFGSLTNYCAFIDPSRGIERIGHFDEASQTVQPLAFKSGTYLSNLYQVIQVGEDGIIPSGDSVPRSSVQLLPPINGRDILCVGKNYSEHAKEFNKSGFDSSDKVDQPTHPVIFSKRFTSIIADGEDIYPHPKFTQTVDYEGELGVIVGKKGFRIGQEEAMDYVWGYTIINDMTARERQRDHKQFYIGKSPDTFCPMVRRSRLVASPAERTPTDLMALGPDRRPSPQTGQNPPSADSRQRGTSAERHDRRPDLQRPVPHHDHE
jgi:2-keto-4-pentenoate hydratase/2-oxohepta-3-ene-1,7-dioic acid hydratase in catechol pathway